MPQQMLLRTPEGPPLCSLSFGRASAAEDEFAGIPLAVGSALDPPASCRCEYNHATDYSELLQACAGPLNLLSGILCS